MIIGVAELILFMLGGGWTSGSLFHHKRFLTWLASGVGIAWGWFLATTALTRTFALSQQQTVILYAIAAIILILVGFLLRKDFRFPPRLGIPDISIILVLLPILISIGFISSANGQLSDGTLRLRSFYQGDVTTFVSLVQKSLLTREWVTDNPFGAGLSLEYPTLLHMSVAEIIHLLGGNLSWITHLPLIVFLTALFTVPLFFLFTDILLPEPDSQYEKWFGVEKRWIVYLTEAGVIFYILGMAWDNYTYPQSHFFLMGLFALFTSLLVSTGKHRGASQVVSYIFAAIAGLVLLLANAVTGAVAIALLMLFGAMHVFDERQSIRMRGWYGLSVVLFGVIFLLLSSGEAQFRLPHFAYGAAGDLLRFAPLIALLTAALLLGVVDGFVSLGVSALCAFALFTFFFAGRGIIVDNASRFFYHAGLVGFPFLVPVVIRLWFWARREVWLTSRPGLFKIVPICLFGVGIVLLLVPVLTSIATTMDHLVRDDPGIISPSEVQVAKWISEHTNPSDVILTPLDSPWFIPFLTGRTIVRAGEQHGEAYWLSAQDEVYATIQKAFDGDFAAQRASLSHAHYLVLPSAFEKDWALPRIRVFDNDIAVYKTK